MNWYMSEMSCFQVLISTKQKSLGFFFIDACSYSLGPDILAIVHMVYYFVLKTIQNNLINIPVHTYI